MNDPNADREPPDVPDDWVVDRIGRRAIWNGSRERCATCRTTVDLSERHYYAELARDVDMNGQRLRSDVERVIFCSRGCLDEWLPER